MSIADSTYRSLYFLLILKMIASKSQKYFKSSDTANIILNQKPTRERMSFISLEEGVGSLLISEKYSDLTITTQTRSFKAHKAIVCTQSKVLAAMSDSGFKETSTSILRIEDDDPAAVERMISFFYSGKYDEGKAPPAAVKNLHPLWGPVLMANTLVYSLADKYDVDPLKALAKSKIEKIDFAAWDCKEFPDIIETVFDSTPDSDHGLRDIMARICSDHVDEVLTSETWKEVLENNGAIGIAILKSARQKSIAELDKQKERLVACKRDLDAEKALTGHVMSIHQQENIDLEYSIAKWNSLQGNPSCAGCRNSRYMGLEFDVREIMTKGTSRVLDLRTAG